MNFTNKLKTAVSFVRGLHSLNSDVMIAYATSKDRAITNADLTKHLVTKIAQIQATNAGGNILLNWISNKHPKTGKAIKAYYKVCLFAGYASFTLTAVESYRKINQAK